MNRPFTVTGGYQSKQGTFGRIVSSTVENVFGLAIHSLSDRCGIVNWGVAIEVFYL